MKINPNFAEEITETQAETNKVRNRKTTEEVSATKSSFLIRSISLTNLQDNKHEKKKEKKVCHCHDEIEDTFKSLQISVG